MSATERRSSAVGVVQPLHPQLLVAERRAAAAAAAAARARLLLPARLGARELVLDGPLGVGARLHLRVARRRRRERRLARGVRLAHKLRERFERLELARARARVLDLGAPPVEARDEVVRAAAQPRRARLLVGEHRLEPAEPRVYLARLRALPAELHERAGEPQRVRVVAVAELRVGLGRATARAVDAHRRRRALVLAVECQHIRL